MVFLPSYPTPFMDPLTLHPAMTQVPRQLLQHPSNESFSWHCCICQKLFAAFCCSMCRQCCTAALVSCCIGSPPDCQDVLHTLQHMRKNQYEEALFRCEDDRFELDMVIECNSSAIRAMQPLAQQLMNQGDAEDRASYRLPAGSLNAVQLRAVQRIYGGCGKGHA